MHSRSILLCIVVCISVFAQTPTSMFMQNASLIHIIDPEQKKKIRELCNQKYVGAEGDLFIFVVDLYRNQQIRKQLGVI